MVVDVIDVEVIIDVTVSVVVGAVNVMEIVAVKMVLKAGRV